ncbi:phage holin family protein [Candidatus Saccharibacteria bacterium]|nr:phage holin family protein [Candidatus Saccharibacteria bacterium]
MSRNLLVFTVRWLFNSLGLWVAVSLLGTGYDNNLVNESITGFLLAGLIFSLINAVLKPIIVILSLPAILLTLGLFMIIVNGLLVYISLRLVPGISMTFLNSIFTGMILSLVNYIVSATLVVKSDSVG